ncbi:hypothetical protein F5Y14DRAFT_464145 [Nemania sp. NC0429]|nr:hypothetical protein F5Y14DRAFT_464145 [Nemania sp. NC0429]
MLQVRVMRTVAALAVVLWSSIALAAPHRHVHHASRRAPGMRASSDVNPFLVTIKPRQMALTPIKTAVKPQNLSVYLRVGFIAQHTADGSTKYFMPPMNSKPGVSITAPAPDLKWTVTPVGTSFKTPGSINSGRIYIADGTLNFFASADRKIVQPDPHNPSDVASEEIWGFIELTHGKDASNGNEDMTVNLSFVDWVSLPLGMNVTFEEGGSQKSVHIPGLNPDGLAKVCDSLSSLDSFWPRLCLRGPDKTPLRVMSPEKYISLHPEDKDAVGYYEPYISQVWEKYKKVDLKINTQTAGPNSNVKVDNGQVVTCRVGSDNILHCDNDAGDFKRPVSRDIYGCDSGPFANPTQGGTESWSRARVRPRLCAAFVRSTLHLDAVQPSHNVTSSMYYKQSITNHYSRVVHENLIEGKGYAFSYDDVNPDSTENSAGLVSMTKPVQLDIFINT